MKSRITFNGKTYERAEDMPPEARKVYERVMAQLPDADRNGVPDVLEGKPFDSSTIDVVEHTSIVVNGRNYSSADQMPLRDRQVYEAAIGRIGAPGAGRSADAGTRGAVILAALILALLATFVAWWVL